MTKRHLLPLLLIYATMGRVTMDLYLPSFPAIQSDFRTSPALVQLTLTIYLLAYFSAQLIWGPTSDRYGRRPVALFGILVGVTGTVIGWLAPNIWTLLVGRFIQGLGLSVSPLFRPMLRDTFQGEKMARIGALITGASAVSLAIAPAIGGYIQEFIGWRANFLITGLYLVVAFLLFWLWLPETNQHIDRWALHPKLLLNKYALLLKTPLFVGYACCSGLTLAGFSAYLTSSSYLLQITIGVSPVTYGWLSWILAAGLATGGLINAAIVHHVGLYRVITIATWAMLTAALAIVLLGLGWTTGWTLMPPAAIYLVGAGMLFPCATAGALTPFPRIAGAAGALYGATQMAGGFLASFVVSFLPEGTQRPLGYLLTITALLTLTLSRWAHKHKASETF